MSQSYVPEGTMVVCTEMKSPQDNSVIRFRPKADVFFLSKKAYLLNKQDLKLQTEFVCNVNSKFWGGLAALCAVIAVGALIIATGGAALVVMAVAVSVAETVAVAAIAVSAYSVYRDISHNCDFTTTSKWIGFHDSVNINGDKALLQNSKLICSQGGALSLVIDPDLARAAGQKMAENNTKEYNDHINSEIIQGGLLVLSSEGDPRMLAFGSVLTVWNYNINETEKQKKRTERLEEQIAGKDKKPENESVLDTVWGEKYNIGRDASILTTAEAVTKPEMMEGILHNASIMKAYPSVISASMKSAYPGAALRLNSSLFFAVAKKSFNPEVLKSFGKGVGWGLGGVAVDAISDHFEDEYYKNTIDYFKALSGKNSESKGINIISNK